MSQRNKYRYLYTFTKDMRVNEIYAAGDAEAEDMVRSASIDGILSGILPRRGAVRIYSEYVWRGCKRWKQVSTLSMDALGMVADRLTSHLRTFKAAVEDSLPAPEIAGTVAFSDSVDTTHRRGW